MKNWQEQFEEWLKELVPFGAVEKYVQLTLDKQRNTIRARIFTDSHQYQISAGETYLGCGASSRKWRAGEDWHRGNDRHDGPFCRETWDKIVRDILRYELTKLEVHDASCVEESQAPVSVTP